MILPFLRLQSQFANKLGPYGYFVFDGFTDPTYPIRTVSIAPGDEVVLASDGYPLLLPSFAQSERELQRLKREDPELIIGQQQPIFENSIIIVNLHNLNVLGVLIALDVLYCDR